MAKVDINSIIEVIKRRLTSDGYESDYVYFRPSYITSNTGFSRYAVNKAIKHMVENGLCNYVSIGGGVDDYGDPCPPWNGYKMTSKGLKEFFPHIYE